jgi:hypothetical protein
VLPQKFVVLNLVGRLVRTRICPVAHCFLVNLSDGASQLPWAHGQLQAVLTFNIHRKLSAVPKTEAMRCSLGDVTGCATLKNLFRLAQMF